LPTFSHFQRHIRWTQRADLAPKALKTWLLDQGSLTAKLIHLSHGHFQVRVLRQLPARASRDEARALGISLHQRCLVREVVLMGGGEDWVYARSVLPLSSLTGRLRHLRKQGNRPLGAFLFSQPQLKRSPIALSLISRHDAYLPDALLGDQQAWGRRSIFYIDAKPLLVSEVFLPGFPGAAPLNK
jgi:chorismate lyase